MISKPQEIKIPENNPFINDKLNRKPLAETMTDIVSFYGQSGCVLALNGEWGSGKTTFVNMWKRMLIEKGFKTLYFNAWTSDFSNDPLIAMIAELKELNSQNDKIINNIASKMGRILLAFAMDFIKLKLGFDANNIKQTTEEFYKIGKEYLEEFASQKETIEEFKKEIKAFVGSCATEYPIVFIVDELDRCNPHYAVAVLERIKHLFDIPNLVFVLAINKKELGHAIQGYYGSDNINSDEYLRRFIDIEYNLPKPNLKAFCEYLYDEYNFEKFFRSESHQKYSRNDEDNFKETAIFVGNLEHTNLRQMEKVFAYSRLVLMQFSTNQSLNSDAYFLLCFWKVMKPDFYNQIKNKELSVQELLSALENMFKKFILQGHDNRIRLTYIIANVIHEYDYTTLIGYKANPTLIPIENSINNTHEYGLVCKILKNEDLNQALDFYYIGQYVCDGLSQIFKRIDLLENFQTKN